MQPEGSDHIYKTPLLVPVLSQIDWVRAPSPPPPPITFLEDTY